MVNLIPRSGIWKNLASAKNDTLVPVLLNETDMERLIVRLLERIVKHGRVSTPNGVPGLEGLDKIVNNLSSNPKISGFSNARGKQILEGWLRASVLSMKRSGRGRSGQENIDYFVPHSAAVYRSGYPRTTSRYRKADLFAYESMIAVSKVTQSFDRFEVAKGIMNLIADEERLESRSVLGKGVEFGAFPRTAPRYQEGATVDIESLLQLRALEGLTGKDPNSDPVVAKLGPFPETYLKLGQDLVAFIEASRDRTSLEVTSGLEAILGFHLYCLPLLSSLAIEREFEIYKSGDESFNAEKLDLYFDFTNDASSRSSEMANLSVARDFKRLRRLFDSMMILRETETTVLQSLKATQYQASVKDNYQGLVAELIKFFNDPEIHTVATVRLSMLMAEMKEEQRELASRLIEDYTNPVEKVSRIVIEDRQREALDGMRKWAYSTGGLEPVSRETANSLLSGTKRAPTTWKYRLSDSMLTTLIQMCFIHEGNPADATRPVRMPMPMLIRKLEERYGIVIDRPPLGMNSIEDNKAAARNKAAFKDKLKMLGLFDGLSDDSNAQIVRNPLGGRNA